MQEALDRKDTSRGNRTSSATTKTNGDISVRTLIYKQILCDHGSSGDE